LDAFQTVAVAQLYQRTRLQASFVFADLLLNEQRKDRVREMPEVAQQNDGRVPAERDAPGRSMDDHQACVDREHSCQTMPRERQMRAAVKDVGGDSANCELDAEETQLAMVEEASHECISFGRDVHANPNDCQLGIKPVQKEQQTTFGQLTHVDLATNVVKLRPYYAETPGAIGGGGS